MHITRETVRDREYLVVVSDGRLGPKTYYDPSTPLPVVEALERARERGSRVRLFCGDAKTGRDWGEENDVTGTVSRSMGPIRIPILVYNSRSIGGLAILTGCIVKLMVDHRVVYQHPSYHQPTYTIASPPPKIGDTDMIAAGYTAGVYADGENVANFHSPSQAQRWIDFMTGKRLTR